MGMNQIGCSFCGTLIRLMGETGWIADNTTWRSGLTAISG